MQNVNKHVLQEHLISFTDLALDKTVQKTQMH